MPLLLHEYVKGPVPAVTVAVAVPVLPPQLEAVFEAVAVKAPGVAIVTDAVLVALFE